MYWVRSGKVRHRLPTPSLTGAAQDRLFSAAENYGDTCKMSVQGSLLESQDLRVS